jgi:hypothetical protein
MFKVIDLLSFENYFALADWMNEHFLFWDEEDICNEQKRNDSNYAIERV